MSLLKRMAFLFVALISFTFFSCNSSISNLETENVRLKKEVDSLKNKLHKCEMLIESYEGMPLNI